MAVAAACAACAAAVDAVAAACAACAAAVDAVVAPLSQPLSPPEPHTLLCSIREAFVGFCRSLTPCYVEAVRQIYMPCPGYPEKIARYEAFFRDFMAHTLLCSIFEAVLWLTPCYVSPGRL